LVSDLPFFGFIVIDNAHDPFFSALTEVDTMRQIFPELLAIRADNFAPLGATNLK
jgi:hypothetical protein